MGIVFNADEIFDIAIQIEKNGNFFYSQAIAAAALSDMKECLTRLAAKELEHAETFTKLSNELDRKGSASFEPEDEAISYLKAFARGHVFDPAMNVSVVMADLHTAGDILRKAIVAEKDSIALYTGIKAFVKDKEGKKKIDAVIAEEMGHLAELSEWLEKKTEGNGGD
jgi:rubrerythrin